MKQIEINLNHQQIETLIEKLDSVYDGGRRKALLLTPTKGAEAISLLITVGHDEDDLMKEAEELMEDVLEACPSCHGDGFVLVDVELPNGKEIEKPYKCQDDWHNE
jgi:hypothetical protein